MSALLPRSVLEVRGLTTEFTSSRGTVRAVADVDLDVYGGSITAVVGESGSGKSTAFYSVMGLIAPPGRIVSGRIRVGDDWIHDWSPRRLRRDVMGRRIGMIFQDPTASLNPSMTIGRLITEVVRTHSSVSRAQAVERAVEVLDLVRIANPRWTLRRHPHELSGGMRQRVMIAMALVMQPEVLIADEPTTALDVTIEAELLDLLRDLVDQLGLALVLVTHDLGVVARVADEVVVMYAGRVVEQAGVHDAFARPFHPYSRGLIDAVPGGASRRGEPMQTIPGSPPDLALLPSGCAFAARCNRHSDQRICLDERPLLRTFAGRSAACHLLEQSTGAEA